MPTFLAALARALPTGPFGPLAPISAQIRRPRPPRLIWRR